MSDECQHRTGIMVSGPPDTGYSSSIVVCSDCGKYGATPYTSSFFSEDQPETFWRDDWESAYEAAREAKKRNQQP